MILLCWMALVVLAMGPAASLHRKIRSIVRLSSSRHGFGGDMFRESMTNMREWYTPSGNACSLLVPSEKVPRAIVHFVGGFVAGAAAPLAYGRMLNTIADAGYLVVVTPIPVMDVNHASVVAGIVTQFSSCYVDHVIPLVGDKEQRSRVPIIGLSHSLGGKLTALLCADKKSRKFLPPRVGNIFLAFNNYGFQQSLSLSQSQIRNFNPKLQKVADSFNTAKVQAVVEAAKQSRLGDVISDAVGQMTSTMDGAGPFANALQDQFGKIIDAQAKRMEQGVQNMLETEFSPNPEKTLTLIQNGYNVQNSALIRFSEDDIDQSHKLEHALRVRGGCDVEVLTLEGDHMTPMSTRSGGGIDDGEAGRGAFGGYLGDSSYRDIDGVSVDKQGDWELKTDEDFMRELLRLLNDFSQRAWTERDRKFYLPSM